MNKTYVGLIVLFFLVAGFIFFSKNADSTEASPSESITVEGDEQVVLLGLDGMNYKPKEIVVQAGKSVVFKNDGTLGGCALYPVQAELGLAGNFAKNKEVRFMPQKKGTFTFTCSMGMYKGIIKVI